MADGTIVDGREPDTPQKQSKSKHEAEFMKPISRVAIGVVAACVALAMLPASALAIARDAVLDRGNVWVNYTRTDSKGKKVTGVPYSQSRWAYESGKLVPTSTPSASTTGYRTDCSGFASLCWSLRDSKGHPYSATTSELGAKGSKKYFEIKKSQLQPGDMILKSTVWGAPVGHAIIFAGWVDAKQKQFWAMEQTTSSSHNGTILHPRTYGEKYYKPYRYSSLEPAYTDCEESVSSGDPVAASLAAARSVYPAGAAAVPALVIANGTQQGDQITGAALSRALSGPLLLVQQKSLPSSVFDEIKRLKPKRVYVLGSTGFVDNKVADKIHSMGPLVIRLCGTNRWQVSAAAMTRVVSEAAAIGRPVDTVYLANGKGLADGVSVTPLLGRTGRPLMFVDKDSMPPYTWKALRASKLKRVVLLGSTGAISAKLEKSLKKSGFTVSRVAGSNASATSKAIADHAVSLKVGFDWKRAGLTSKTSFKDALVWGWASGMAGQVYMLTPSTSLDGTVRGAYIAHRKVVGKARVYGSSSEITSAVRKRLATALRSGK
jgi:putative cell wall-binding protein